MIFTLIAYKENAVDSCRNCVMERYDSDFQMEYSTSANDIALKWATIQHRAAHRNNRDTEYEYTLLIDGVDVNNEPFEANYTDEQSNARCIIYNDVLVKYKTHLANMEHELVLEQSRQKEVLRINTERKQAEAKLIAEKNERLELARLQDKYK